VPLTVPKPLRAALRRILNPLMARAGYLRFDAKHHYAEDGVFSVHNDSFRHDPAFQAAYVRGVQAGWGVDPHFEWRVHVALWAAGAALRVPGDFIECGVNAGFMSSAIMHRLDWAGVPRKFFLVDTFAGPVVEQYTDIEVKMGKAALAKELLVKGAYVTDVERARANFAEWPNAVVVAGVVPDVLASLPLDRLAFAHIDLNCAYPERAALEYFWPRLSPGAIVLLDDYANHEYVFQKQTLDETARLLNTAILSLPTGQGLLVR
jgi:hypothetical protein